jgi:hypothetical protein
MRIFIFLTSALIVLAHHPLPTLRLMNHMKILIKNHLMKATIKHITKQVHF